MVTENNLTIEMSGHNSKEEAIPAQDPESLQEPEPPSRQVHGISWILAVLAILITPFLFALDNTITADIIPVIVKDFGGSNKLPWLSVAFMMGALTFVLPYGSFYTLFDTKKIYIGSLVVFTVGSALCGAAPNINAFIIGRVIAGVGGIGMYLGVMNLLSVNTSATERPLYLGLAGLVFGIGTIVGPLVGGGLTDSKATWRWGFYLNLCVIGLASPAYIFLVPSFKPQKSRGIFLRLADIDIFGILLSIGSLVCLVMAINFGGTLYFWNSGQIIALFALSGVLLISFATQQHFVLFTTKESRLFPIFLLKNKEAILLFILTATFSSAVFIPIYYIPTYFQFTRGDAPLESAVRLLPLIVFYAFLIIVNGGILSRGSYYMPWFLVGSILTLIAGVLFSLIDITTSTGTIYGYEVLVGFGSGCGIQAGFAVIQTVTQPKLVTSGISFIMIAQLLGVSLALSVSGAIFVNTALQKLEDLLVGYSSAELEAALLGLSGDFLSTLDPSQRSQALAIIVASLSKIFIPVYAASALGIVASLGLRRVKMAPAVSV